MKILIFWDVALCHWASSFRRFEGLVCLRNVGIWLPGETPLYPRGIKTLFSTALRTSDPTRKFVYQM